MCIQLKFEAEFGGEQIPTRDFTTTHQTMMNPDYNVKSTIIISTRISDSRDGTQHLSARYPEIWPPTFFIDQFV